MKDDAEVRENEVNEVEIDESKLSEKIDELLEKYGYKGNRGVEKLVRNYAEELYEKFSNLESPEVALSLTVKMLDVILTLMKEKERG